MNETNSLVFDLPIQRKGNVWDIKRKSKMVHSVILNWPTASLIASKEGRTLNFLDGKQRLTTLISFVENGFALDKISSRLKKQRLKKWKSCSSDWTTVCRSAKSKQREHCLAERFWNWSKMSPIRRSFSKKHTCPTSQNFVSLTKSWFCKSSPWFTNLERDLAAEKSRNLWRNCGTKEYKLNWKAKCKMPASI